MAKKKKKIAKRKRSRRKKALGGPFLQAAAICEKVITEKDNVVSLIRMVDRLTFMIQGPAGIKPRGVLGITVLIGFKAGDFEGKRKLEVSLWSPEGKQIAETGTKVHLQGRTKGPESGQTVQLEFPVPVENVGVNWLSVSLGGKEMTKIPFRIRHQRLKQNSP